MTQNYTDFITGLLDITSNCEGAELVSEVEDFVSKYDEYFYETLVPESVANWVKDLYNLLDNCEGAELQRELADLKSPLQESM